jgi:hypothetical protein
MLYELIKVNRELLLSRAAKLSAENGGHSDLQTATLAHVSIFLDQLIDALQVENGTPTEVSQAREDITSPAPAVQLSQSSFGHGQELRESSLSIGAVVRNYGNICQAITGYAVEVNATIDPAEFRTLNWCLDEVIAQAVIAFTTITPPDAGSLKTAQSKRLAQFDGFASMIGHIECMANSISAIQTGRVGVDGATAALLDKSLNAMRDLVEQEIDRQF